MGPVSAAHGHKVKSEIVRRHRGLDGFRMHHCCDALGCCVGKGRFVPDVVQNFSTLL
jgi:hypothetical protein